MFESQRMGLPLLAAAQAQKHITHNEALLRLDALGHPVARTRTLTAPPEASEGDLFVIAHAATGEWSGQDHKLAEHRNGAWDFMTPFEGLSVYLEDEDITIRYLAAQWREADGVWSQRRVLARSGFGAESRHHVIDAELTGLTGAFVETPPLIPDRAIVYCVSTRTVADISGASSYDCGLAGEVARFGGSLGVGAGSFNLGVIGPAAFYADTPVRLTANGGSFTGGTVRLAVHCFVPTAPRA